MSDDVPRHRHRKTRRQRRRRPRASIALFSLLCGVLLGLGAGMSLAFGLPAAYFRQEWTQVQNAPPALPTRIALVPVAPESPSGQSPSPSVRSRYEERTWQIIGSLEEEGASPAP